LNCETIKAIGVA